MRTKEKIEATIGILVIFTALFLIVVNTGSVVGLIKGAGIPVEKIDKIAITLSTNVMCAFAIAIFLIITIRVIVTKKPKLNIKERYMLLSIGYLDKTFYTMATLNKKGKVVAIKVYEKLDFSESPTVNSQYVPRQTSETTAKGTVTKVELVPFVIE